MSAVLLPVLTIWDALASVAPIIAPIVSLVLLFVGKLLVNHERRIRDSESSVTRIRRSVYGDKDNEQQPGLAEEFRRLEERVGEIEDRIDDMERQSEND